MSECLSWLWYLFGQSADQSTTSKRKRNIPQLSDDRRRSIPQHPNGRRRRNIPQLPDDIIIDILSRLPADFVVKFQSVCKNWKALISSNDFARLQLKRATPTVLVNYEFWNRQAHLIILDEKAKHEPIEVHPQEIVLLSCDGLLLSRNSYKEYFLSNPLSPLMGRVPIHKPPGISFGRFIGFFFHPIASEYKLLYVDRDGMFFRYSIYSVQAKLWKEIAIDSFSLQPFSAPTISNGALYWIVNHNEHINAAGVHSCENAFMIFNMDTEDIFTMPNPFNRQHWDLWREPDRMNLLAKEGSLTFCLVDCFYRCVNIWILEDCSSRTWAHAYTVKIDFCKKTFPYDYRGLNKIKLLYIWNEELILDWSARGIFRCHLDKNIVHKMISPKRILWGLDYIFSGAFYRSLVTVY